MLHHLVGGAWGLTIRRPLEAGAMTLLPLAILFVPIALGLIDLPVDRPGDRLGQRASFDTRRVSERELLPGPRAGIYFAIWIVLRDPAPPLVARRRDREEDGVPPSWLQAVSGPGLVVYFFTGTFAAIDWGMSLEPDWYLDDLRRDAHRRPRPGRTFAR